MIDLTHYAPIAERDGLTPDQAYVLVMQWSWPWGIAIRPAFEKARTNHSDWQAWLAEKRTQPIPTLDEWDAFTKEHSG